HHTLVLFSPRSCSPPALHSFPTRRSSDLYRVVRSLWSHRGESLRGKVTNLAFGRAGTDDFRANRLTSDAVTEPRMRLGNVDRLRSEEHTSELQSRENLVCRLLLEKKKK